jgi:hypothetical protein
MARPDAFGGVGMVGTHRLPFPLRPHRPVSPLSPSEFRVHAACAGNSCAKAKARASHPRACPRAAERGDPQRMNALSSLGKIGSHFLVPNLLVEPLRCLGWARGRLKQLQACWQMYVEEYRRQP